MQQYDRYPILIDGRWTLEDLYKFPRAYEQTYFAFEALLPTESLQDDERIIRAFTAYPWTGGYSAVNFYNQLKYATKPSQRPNIISIKYASPGWIEMLLNLPLAIHIGASISSVAFTISQCNRVYHRIYTDMQSRKLLRIEIERKEIELTQDQIRLVRSSVDEMATMMGLGSAEIINQRTKDPLISLKILLSVYRRIRTLAEYVEKGKANFENNITKI